MVDNESNPVGRPRKYEPDGLAEIFEVYQVWRLEHPLKKPMPTKNGVVDVSIERPMSLREFCVQADISRETWSNYCQLPEFLEVTSRIRNIVEGEQIVNGLVGNYNGNLVARLSSIKDNQDHTSGGDPITGTVVFVPQGEKPIIED